MTKYDCAETFRRLHDYLDRELSPIELELVEDHLSGCGMCAEEFRFEASVLRVVRRHVAHEPVPSDLFERLLTPIRQLGG